MVGLRDRGMTASGSQMLKFKVKKGEKTDVLIASGLSIPFF
jgi:hypothetical protein